MKDDPELRFELKQAQRSDWERGFDAGADGFPREEGQSQSYNFGYDEGRLNPSYLFGDRHDSATYADPAPFTTETPKD